MGAASLAHGLIVPRRLLVRVRSGDRGRLHQVSVISMRAADRTGGVGLGPRRVQRKLLAKQGSAHLPSRLPLKARHHMAVEVQGDRDRRVA